MHGQGGNLSTLAIKADALLPCPPYCLLLITCRASFTFFVKDAPIISPSRKFAIVGFNLIILLIDLLVRLLLPCRCLW